MMAKYFALMEDDNGVTAVGPFQDSDKASDWADHAEYEQTLGTCRGIVAQIAPSKWTRGER